MATTYSLWTLVYEILDLLNKEEFHETTYTLIFGDKKKEIKSLEDDIRKWCDQFIRYVAIWRLSCNDNFKRFTEFLIMWSKEDFGAMKRIVFDDCKIIMTLTPLILDSDNIKIGENAGKDADDDKEKEKVAIIRPLMLFLDSCTCEPDENIQHGKITDCHKRVNKPKKHVKNILKQLFEQPGLTANLIFNLNSPSGDDEKILSAFIAIVGNMCLHLRKL